MCVCVCVFSTKCITAQEEIDFALQDIQKENRPIMILPQESMS